MLYKGDEEIEQKLEQEDGYEMEGRFFVIVFVVIFNGRYDSMSLMIIMLSWKKSLIRK